MDKERQPIRIQLTPEQQERVRRLTGEEVDAFSFTAEELEERIAPRLAQN